MPIQYGSQLVSFFKGKLLTIFLLNPTCHKSDFTRNYCVIQYEIYNTVLGFRLTLYGTSGGLKLGSLILLEMRALTNKPWRSYSLHSYTLKYKNPKQNYLFHTCRFLGSPYCAYQAIPYYLLYEVDMLWYAIVTLNKHAFTKIM